ncbi:MAG: Gfo/Idh/MocA family protein [Kiritimatiellia bacterium]|jgi:predicted dehydrogenase
MSETKAIRLGLVGFGSPHGKFDCGRGGGLFQQAVNSFDGVMPAAVCDISCASLSCARKVFPKIKTFTDYDTMLKSASLDALLIGTPATLHAEFAAKALKNNVHVLSEIPAVMDSDEAGKLWAAQKRSKSFYMTGANPNFWGFVDTAVELKQKGLFGDPIYVEASYIHDLRHYFDRTPWRADYEPIRYCTHSLGPVLRLLEEELEWVSCFDTGSHINKVKGQHDVMAALFRTKSNVVVRLLVSFINNYLGGGHAYRFFTTKGCFERTPPYRTFRKEPVESQRTLFYSSDLKLFNNWVELPIAEMPPAYAGNPKAVGHGGVDYAMLDAFIKAVKSGGPSPIGLKEGLRMTLPGIFAAESARQGGKLVRIKYPWHAQA